SDKDDYLPGETVLLSGSGWAPGEPLDIDVTCDGVPPEVVIATADDAGAFAGAIYVIAADGTSSCTATAMGGVSGATAQTSFTDSGLGTGSKRVTSDGTHGVPRSANGNWIISPDQWVYVKI